jgi:hypothetical protein
LFLWALSPLDDLATFGLAATMVPGDHYSALRGVFISVDLAAYAKAIIFATILRDVFSGVIYGQRTTLPRSISRMSSLDEISAE